MTKVPKASLRVVVTGDVTIDWNIAYVNRERIETLVWTDTDFARACWQRGGAALLADLVTAVGKQVSKDASRKVSILTVGSPPDRVTPSDCTYHHSYAIWESFKRDKDPKEYWRVSRFLGVDRCEERKSRVGSASRRVHADPPRADLIVIDDANLGFRENESLWPRALKAGTSPPWVVLKMSRPVASGKLWNHLLKHLPHRLVVVMTVGDLRRTEAQISGQISWEQTAEDLVRELTHNPCVNGLSRCAHAIVSFDTTGAMLLSRTTGAPKSTLLFDSSHMEGEWSAVQGRMIGYTSTLASSIAREILLAPNDPDIEKGIQSGIAAMRHLQQVGYDQGSGNPPCLRFPIEEVVSQLAEGAVPLKRAAVPIATEAGDGGKIAAGASGYRRHWSILSDALAADPGALATRIVIDGLQNTLDGVPLGAFHHLRTVDRREIEALRSIRALIEEYCDRPQPRPLSIAVFGPPGAGKSFAIKEVASSIRPGSIQPLTFNLSQFDRPEDLLGAFHQVRDLSLSGKMPLVFWDEFDTELGGRSLGWLRYFLAPMQDGEFQEGQITHPIGRAVFVFAGGTKSRMADFNSLISGSAPKAQSPGVIDEAVRAAKVPDFISRLRGFLNVLGPNPQSESGFEDRFFMIRRAILLRSMLERAAPALLRERPKALQSKGRSERELRIDSGVLRAFLFVGRYRHGARSIESIIAMSRLANRTTFERSSLPPMQQLDLHVDATEFMALVQQLELGGELLEQLARAQHESFCADLRSKKYKYGAQTDDRLKRHSALVDYAALSAHDQEQNRAVVRDVPNKLARFGYIMAPSRPGDSVFSFPESVVAAMAKQEHDRWMAMKVVEGWTQAKRTNKARKQHTSLLPWEALPESEKDKDRQSIRNIPKLLARVGYTVIALGGVEREE